MESSDVSRPRGREQETPDTRRLRSLSRRELLDQAVQLPNVLSFLRIASVPVLVWALFAGHALTALLLFVAASLSDGLDGLLARLLNKRTLLGSYIDPIADKLLTLSALVALTIQGALPAWLLGLVLIRDGGIVLAALVLRVTGRDVPASPTRLGKYATFLLFLTMTLAFARGLETDGRLMAPIAVTGLLAAQCVLGATIQYFLRWRRLMHLPPPTRQRPSPPAGPPRARPMRPPPVVPQPPAGQRPHRQ